jgi:hypothetical protein
MPSFAQIPKIATNNISANRPEIELTKHCIGNEVESHLIKGRRE